MDNAITKSTAVYFRPGTVAGDIFDNELKEGFHAGSRVRSVRSHRRSELVVVWMTLFTAVMSL
jgi:hypothetical protein